MKSTMILALLTVALMALLVAMGCESESEVRSPAGAKLTLEKPNDVTIERGGTADVDVRIGRENLAGEISVKFGDLPAGVTVVDADKKIVGNEGTYMLRAAADAALVANQQAKVTVTGPSGMGMAETFMITVKEREAGETPPPVAE